MTAPMRVRVARLEARYTPTQIAAMAAERGLRTSRNGTRDLAIALAWVGAR